MMADEAIKNELDKDRALLHKGDNESWEKLISEELPRLMLYARKFGLSEEEAISVCKEAFIRLIRGLRERGHPWTPKNYLYKIAMNIMLDFHRRLKRSNFMLADTDLTDESTLWIDESTLIHFYSLPTPDEVPSQEERINMMMEGFKQLTQKQRELINDFVFNNNTTIQIAKKMGVSVKTVQNQLTNAIKKLYDQNIRKERKELYHVIEREPRDSG